MAIDGQPSVLNGGGGILLGKQTYHQHLCVVVVFLLMKRRYGVWVWDGMMKCEVHIYYCNNSYGNEGNEYRGRFNTC